MYWPRDSMSSAGLNFMLGREDRSERVRTYRSPRVRIHSEPELPFSIDGEPTRALDAKFEVVPAALRVVCTPDAPALNSPCS